MGRHSASSSRHAAWLLWLGALVVVVVVALVSALVLAPGPEPADDRAEAPETTSSAPGTSPSTAPPPSTTPPTTLPTTTPPPDPGITLAFAGDVHFTGRTRALLDDPATAFGPISRTLAAADLAMVNLETAITQRGQAEPKEFHFRTPTTALDAMAEAGVDVASLANNHAVDYGEVGLEDTLAAVDSGVLPLVGVGPDAASAYAPWRTTVRGTSIAFFAASQVPDRTFQAWTATTDSPGIASTADQGRLVNRVREASQAGDVVVVYLHWGIEGDSCPSAEMGELATALTEAGADAIVGTHAHLLLGAGWLTAGPNSAYVAYGLGNFVWWRSRAFSDDTGVLTLTVRDGAVVAAALTPAVIDDDGRPQPVTGPAVDQRRGAFQALRDCTTLQPER